LNISLDSFAFPAYRAAQFPSPCGPPFAACCTVLQRRGRAQSRRLHAAAAAAAAAAAGMSMTQAKAAAT
jgi:hypothetical protein